MQKPKKLQAELERVTERYGPWSFDIPLGSGIWTRGNKGMPLTRLRRILQVATDLLPVPLARCRVLDLGCLDGIFSIEFALHGAEVVGIDARSSCVGRAQFAGKALGLDNLKFVEADVRDLSIRQLGRFDLIICSGILYHLGFQDACHLTDVMFEFTKQLVIIDTCISLNPTRSETYLGCEYHGSTHHEHPESATEAQKMSNECASFPNPESFWFTRPSLVNRLSHAVFSSTYEAFNPPHWRYSGPAVRRQERCTLVARKSEAVHLYTSPVANECSEDWPEDALRYCKLEGKLLTPVSLLSRFRRIIARLLTGSSAREKGVPNGI